MASPALPKQRQSMPCRSHRASIAAFASSSSSSSSPPLLEVKGLEAVIAATGQQILKGVDLTLRAGEVRRERERERERES